MSKDYYKILRVDKGASIDDIKKSYRKLAIKYHPDTNSGDKEAEAKFKEISEAYAVLSDPDKKAQYDMYGESKAGGYTRHSRSQAGFEDIFKEVFGGMGGMGGFRSNHRPTAQAKIEVPLAVALFGGTVPFTFTSTIKCKKCNGSGYTSFKACPQCGGSGTMSFNQGPGMHMTFPCQTCMGAGKIPEEVCSECHGSGVEKNVDTTLNVVVPKGSCEGTTIRMPNVYPTDQGKVDVMFVVTLKYPNVDNLTPEEQEILKKLR